MAEEVQISLAADEALILFELLSRWSEGEGAKPPAECFDSAAESAALLDLLAMLEAQLSEPFADDYEQRLAAARARLTAKVGPDFTL